MARDSFAKEVALHSLSDVAYSLFSEGRALADGSTVRLNPFLRFFRPLLGEHVHRLLARVLLGKPGSGQLRDLHRVPFEQFAADSRGVVALRLHSLR